MRISVERLTNYLDRLAEQAELEQEPCTGVELVVYLEDEDKLYLLHKALAELSVTADKEAPIPVPKPVKTWAGGKPNYVQEQEQEEDAANEAEDEAWEFLQRMRSVQERNKAAMAAWQAAGLFVVQNADRLGRLSLREAFEKGYMQGYHKALHGDKEDS